MYIDAERIRGTNDVMVWCRDDKGTLYTYQDTMKHYCYVESPKGEYQSIFGHKLARVDFDTWGAFERYKQSKSNLFESDINSIYKYLSDTFHDASPGTLNVGLFDIEVYPNLEAGKGYPIHDDPHGYINSISLFDRTKQVYHLFLLDSDHITVQSPDGLPVEHHYHSQEIHLLYDFFHTIKPIDILSAWHGDGFDIPYMIARTAMLLGPNATRHFCRSDFRPIARTLNDDYGNEETRYMLVGRPHIDMLKAYKKFTFEERPSYKLDSIAEEEVGERKTEYSGDLGRLYNEDRQTFYDYSLRDTYLLKKLDDKLRHIDLVVTMARQASVRFNDVFGSIRYLEHTILNYCHFHKDPMLIVPDKKDHLREAFPGALVFKTMTGVHGWSTSIDLTSLYPSVIMALGISPESIVMQCESRGEDFVRIVERQETMVTVVVRNNLTDERESFTISARELDDVIRSNGYTLSANGTIFDGRGGIIPEVIRLWFETRKQLKDRMKVCAKAGDHEGEKFYDMRQHIQKINLNSLYGMLANPFSRFFDIEMARSITLTGQEIAKHQTRMADEIVRGAV